MALVMLSAAAAHAPSAQAARGLTLGIFDSVFHAPERDAWLQRTRESGGTVIRIHTWWGGVAPSTRPSGFQPANPADPHYRWNGLDDAVRSAQAAGMTVLLSTSGTPRWAEGANRPASAPPGSWKPDVREFAAFASALARRYSGSFPDPAAPGKSLPRVRFWQPWNEPNLHVYLTPQWRRGRPYSPHHFRRLQNAFYAAVKSVDRSNTVLASGTAPYGDPFRGGRRIPPRAFWREVFCIRRRGCGPVRFDVFAHHPYSIRGPRAHAYSPDDIAVADLGRLVRVLRQAERRGRVLPRGRRRVWITEVSWDSSPPDPDGVPARRHALWLEEALYVLWQQGADAILWQLIRDAAPNPSYGATVQAGLYLRDGRPKPALRAYRFPFVTSRWKRGRVQLWMRAPTAGDVVVRRRVRGRWQRFLAFRATADGQVLTRTVRIGRGTRLRAVAPGATSLMWTVR